jgi:hypothetical protein
MGKLISLLCAVFGHRWYQMRYAHCRDESAGRCCRWCGKREYPPPRIGTDDRDLKCPGCGFETKDFPGSVNFSCGTCHRLFIEATEEPNRLDFVMQPPLVEDGK